MKVKGDTLLIVGAIAVAAYVLYRLFAKAKEKVDAGADAIAQPIADAWLSWFLPDPVTVNASIRLPDGRMLDATAVHVTKEANGDRMIFAYMGKQYELLPRTPQGFYGSKLLG